jgi:hypothetical protein
MFILPSLDSLIPAGLPYAIRGSIIRGVRGVISAAVSFAVVGIGNGTILQGLHLSPEISVLIAATLTPALQTIDKYLRERGYEEDSTVNTTPTDPIPPDTAPPVVVPPAPVAPTSDPAVDLGPVADAP